MADPPQPPHVLMHSIPGCGYCAAARRLLDRRGIEYEEKAGDPSSRGRARLANKTGGRTFPQVVVDGEPVGGYRELKRFARSGGLGPAPSRPSLWERLRGAVGGAPADETHRS